MDNIIHLLELPFGGSTLYFTDDGYNFDYNGHTWLAGFLKQIPEIEQTSRIKENRVSYELHDIDNSLITTILSQSWKYQRPILYRLKLNWDMSPQTLYTLHRGWLVNYSHTETDEGKVVTLESVNRFANGQQRGRKSNVPSQHQVDPTDYCFEETPFIKADIPWGRDKPRQPYGGGGRGGRGGLGAPTDKV